MFNSGVRGRKAKDGEGVVSPQAKFVQTASPQPTISSYSISGVDDTALDIAGGQTVIINGTGFATGVSATVGGTQIGAVTLVSPTQITFTAPAKSSGSYALVVYNSVGTAAILVPGLTYSSMPTFTTPAGTIGSVYETKSINTSLVATSDSAVTYSVVSGSLPAGATLSSSGTITGTAPADSGSTTYTFSVKATDAEQQDVTRTFSLTVNTDVVTWATPSSGATINLDGTSFSQALSATDAAGYSVSYTANSLPTGLTLSAGTISGIPTVEGSTTTLLTGTASTTNRSSTNTITWIVTLTDLYFKYTTLLLSADPAIVSSGFASDASLNNTQLTIFGDTRPSNFDGITPGYSSIYLNGSSCYRIAAANTLDGQFTMEAWLYPIALAGDVISNSLWDCGWDGGFHLSINSNGTLTLYSANGTGNTDPAVFTTTNALTIGNWYHVAITRDGTNSMKCFINGVQGASVTWTYPMYQLSPYGGSCYGNSLLGSGIRLGAKGAADTTAVSNYYTGYISNFHVDNTTAYYTSSFTPPATPVVKKKGTQYLAAHTTLDWTYESGPARIPTTFPAGTPVQSNFNPFTTKYQYSSSPTYSTSFNTKTDYVSTPAVTNLTTFTGDFTFECWIYPQDTTITYWGIWDSRQAGQTANSTVINIVPLASPVTGQGRICYYNGGYNYGTGIVYYNKWSHIAVVRSGTTLTFYINGTAGGTANVSGTQTGNATTNPIIIGSKDNSLGGYGILGSISNFRIVNGTAVYTSNFTPPTGPLTAITNTVLLALNDSSIKDSSTNAYALTPSSTTIRPIIASPFDQSAFTGTVSTLSGSTYFDGTGDYIKTPTLGGVNFGTGDFTIECWVWLDSAAGANASFFTTCPAATYNGVIMGRDVIGIFSAGGGTLNNVSVSLSTSVWTHVAMTRSGTSLRVFLNGVQTGSTMTNSSDVNSSLGTIGARYVEATGYLWLGYISNLRVVKGTALYTNYFAPSLVPLTAIANTQLLTNQQSTAHNNSSFVDKSSTTNLISRSGNASNGTFSPYGSQFSVYFSGTSGLQTPASSLTTIIGSSSLVTSTFTIEAWIFPTVRSGSTDGSLVGDMSPSAGTNNWSWGPRNDGKLNFNWYTGSTNNCTGSSTIPLNTWTHIALVVTTTTIKMFVNGSLETLSGTTTLTAPSSSLAYLGMGCWNNGTSGNNMYAGYVSNLRIVKTALYSANFIVGLSPLLPISNTSVLLNSQTYIDNSPNNYLLTTTGSPQIQKFSPFGAVTMSARYFSTKFDGSADVLTLPSTHNIFAASSEDFTIECWIYLTAAAGAHNMICGWNASPWDYWEITSTGTTLNMNNTYTVGVVYTFAINTWYHLAISRVSNSVKLYINGSWQSTVTNSTNLGSGTVAFKLGNWYTSPNYFFPGYISNFRFIKGTGLYTSTTTITVPTAPLTAVSGTQLLTCQDSTFKDNSTNNYAVTAGTTVVKPLPFSPFAVSYNSASAYTQTTFGGSMYFDGTGDSVAITSSASNNFGANNFTMEWWMYPTNTSTANQSIFHTGTSNLVVLMLTGGIIQPGNYQTSGIVNPATGVPQNAWTHVALTRSSSTWNVYYNGVLAGTGSYSFTPNTSSFTLGAGATAYNGYLADFKLTGGSVLYTSNFYPGTAPATIGTNTNFLLSGTNGGVIDATRTTDLETVADSRSVQFSPYNGNYYSVYSDGNADYLTVPSATWTTLAGTFTVEFWAKWDTAAAAGSFLGMQSAGGWSLYNDGTRISPNLYGSANIFNSTFLVANIVLGNWYHIAVTRDSANLMTMWVNGVSVGSTTTSTTYTQGIWTIHSPSNVNCLQGNISNHRVTNTCLYTTTFTPSTAPLTAVAGTQLLTCQSNKFIDASANAATITPYNTAAVKTQNPFQVNTGQSYYFDGTGDYLYSVSNTLHLIGTADYTLEFWVYSTIAWASVICFYNNNNSGYFLQYNTGTGLQTGIAGSSTTGTYAVTLSSGSWNHIAISRASSSSKCFVNGVQVGTTLTDTTNYAQNGAYIGALYNGSQALTGYIADLRVTKYARYTTAFTPPIAPLKTN